MGIDSCVLSGETGLDTYHNTLMGLCSLRSLAGSQEESVPTLNSPQHSSSLWRRGLNKLFCNCKVLQSAFSLPPDCVAYLTASPPSPTQCKCRLQCCGCGNGGVSLAEKVFLTEPSSSCLQPLRHKTTHDLY